MCRRRLLGDTMAGLKDGLKSYWLEFFRVDERREFTDSQSSNSSTSTAGEAILE